jgi:hypothetical protein
MTVMRPVRAEEVLAATEYEIVAFPFPDEADEIVSHVESLAAVQAQPDTVVNVLLNEPPELSTACVVGFRDAEHGVPV